MFFKSKREDLSSFWRTGPIYKWIYKLKPIYILPEHSLDFSDQNIHQQNDHYCSRWIIPKKINYRAKLLHHILIRHKQFIHKWLKKYYRNVNFSQKWDCAMLQKEDKTILCLLKNGPVFSLSQAQMKLFIVVNAIKSLWIRDVLLWS